MANSALDKLSADLLTKEDQIILIEKLQASRSSLFQIGKIGQQEAVAEIKTLLNQAEVKTDQQKLLEDLINQVEKIETLKLTLAFEPSRNFLTKVKKILEEQIGSVVVLDVNLDKTILAGLVIERDGNYFDYSSKRALEQLTEDQKFLATLFKRYQDGK